MDASIHAMGSMIRSATLLGVAVLLGGAQSGPKGPPPGSDKPGNIPPQALRLPTGRPVPLGPGVSDGDAVFDVPRRVDASALPASVPLAVDAVVASETLRLLPVHSKLAGPIAIGPPFNISHPAGTDVPRLLKDDRIRNCLRQRGWFTPPRDERGEIYPSLCLEDRDGDGLYETAILLPYDQARLPERVVRIAPVRLAPNSEDAEADPDGHTARRRIRVTHIGPDEVEVVIEQGLALSRRHEITDYYSMAEHHLTIPLREGARGSLGGIELRLHRDGTGWRIAATGRFAPWLEVRENGNLIVVGGMEHRRRPSL
jgi:hypothetical protein